MAVRSYSHSLYHQWFISSALYFIWVLLTKREPERWIAPVWTTERAALHLSIPRLCRGKKKKKRHFYWLTASESGTPNVLLLCLENNTG